MKASQVAVLLGVTRQWVLHLCLEGRIPTAVQGEDGQWDIPEGEIEILAPARRPSRKIVLRRKRAARKPARGAYRRRDPRT
jgi:predicted site-specific integrase-resolvase